MWSKHAPKSVQFLIDTFGSSTLMSKAVIKLCVYAGTLERCKFVFFLVWVFWWNRERAFFLGGVVTPFGSFGIPPYLVELSPLSCGCNSA